MPMPSYPVICYGEDCLEKATYKIAARWSDGLTSELKTYGMSCATCLKTLFLDARRRRDLCRLAPGELLDQPRIYLYSAELRDRDREPMTDLEATLTGFSRNDGS
jgi:hypothetical protein